jgi:hypothetical protein
MLPLFECSPRLLAGAGLASGQPSDTGKSRVDSRLRPLQSRDAAERTCARAREIPSRVRAVAATTPKEQDND